MAVQDAGRPGRQEREALLAAAAAGIVCAGFTLFQQLAVKVGLAIGAGAAAVGVFLFPHLAVALVVLLLPLQNLFPKLQGGPLTTLQPATLLLPLTALAVVTRAWIARDYRLKWTPLSAPVIAFAAGLLVLVAFRSIAARPPDELLSVNVKMVGRFLMGTALFFLMTQCVTTVPRLRLIVWAFVIGGTVATAIGIAQYYLGFELVTSFGKEEFEVDSGAGGAVTRVKSTLGSPHGFAFLAAILVLLMVCLALYSRGAGRKATYWGAAAFYFAGLWSTQARAGLVLLAVGLAVLMLRRRQYALLVGLIGALIAFQLIAIAFPGAAGRFGKTIAADGSGSFDYSTMWRMHIYSTALDAIESNPLFGTGLIYLYMRKPGSAWTAHSSYLDMWIAGGVILLSLFVWLLWRALGQAWTYAAPGRFTQLTAYASWLLASLGGIAVFVMVDIIECEYYRPIAFYCLLGMCAVVTRVSKR